MNATALSIREPWISLILAGRKTVLIRPRPTILRGELHLHVSREFGRAEREAAAAHAVEPPGPDRLGSVIGKVRVVDCRLAGPDDWAAALIPPREGRYWAWVLEAPEAVAPFPVRGWRNLFTVELPHVTRRRGRPAA